MHHPDLLRITVEPLEDARLIRAAGELDRTTAPALRLALDAAREKAATAVLDLSEVTFIDSAGLRLLLGMTRRSVAGPWAFFIVRPSPPVQRLIELSGTYDALALVDSTPASVLG